MSSLDQSPDGIVCPFMEAEGYQSYLGVPIIVDGIASGVLQIMAFEAHDWSGPEKEKLAEYAGSCRRCSIHTPQVSPQNKKSCG